jgi:hypothetical protein
MGNWPAAIGTQDDNNAALALSVRPEGALPSPNRFMGIASAARAFDRPTI